MEDVKESKYWKVEFSDFIKSDCRWLEVGENATDENFEQAIASFLGKHPHCKADYYELLEFIRNLYR